jgi:hypothetical protein
MSSNLSRALTKNWAWLGAVALLLSSCGGSSYEKVYTYSGPGRSIFVTGHSGYPTVARWEKTHWAWLDEEHEFGSGVYARWTALGEIDAEFSGRYEAGELAEPWAKLAESAELTQTTPPLRWSGMRDGNRGATGDWIALDASGRVVWLVQYAWGMEEGLILGWHPNGAVRLQGEYHVSEPCGEWNAWSEDGRQYTKENVKDFSKPISPESDAESARKAFATPFVPTR